jgi:hypothetical protein
MRGFLLSLAAERAPQLMLDTGRCGRWCCRDEPQRGGLAQPRPTAWVREPVPFLAAFWQQALKGRKSMVGRTRTAARGYWVPFITPLQGLKTLTG